VDLGISDVTPLPITVSLDDLQGASAADLVVGTFAGKLDDVERLIFFVRGSDGL
jgi:hypothetical protein